MSVKKVFYISLCVFVLVGIFLIAYNFVFRNNPNNPIADPSKLQAENEEGAPTPVENSLLNPINEEILGASIGPDGSLYYFSLSDKALKKATLEGKGKITLLSNLPGFIERVLWSPQHDKALIVLRSTTGSLWHYADLSTKTLTPLRPEMSRLAWNNLGDKILYQFTDPKTGARSLNLANPDGSNWKKLAELGRTDTYSAPIPKSASLSFWSRPNALEKTTFETIGISGENRKTILRDKLGADYLWSPTGETILVSTTDASGGLELATMNKNGGEYRTLSIPTLISKAVWNKNGDAVYYALPGALPSGSLLPNDYWAKPLYTQDTFWKMDLATGKKTRLVELKDLTQSFDSTELTLWPNEDALFFTDRKTHRLYRIDL